MRKIPSVRAVSLALALVSAVVLSLVATGCSRAISVEYGDGKEVTLPKRPSRIVSLAPSNTEILFALGADELLCGVTSYCDYPPEAKDKPDVGGFIDFSAEKIVSLNPDLILATSGQDQGLAPLIEMGIPVVVLDAATIEEIADCVRVIGELTGRKKEAQRLIADMNSAAEAVTSQVAAIPESEKPKVMYVAWDDPILTVGPGTLIHHLIDLAGGVNVAQAAGDLYPTMSMEAVVVEDPDVLLLPRVHGGLDLSALRERDAWKDLTAVREGRVYLLEDNLISRPSPRAIQGLREIAAALHPALFEVKKP
ncbi:MAG: ABC transporter substrate-binding protein [Bacillota bacterium]